MAEDELGPITSQLEIEDGRFLVQRHTRCRMIEFEDLIYGSGFVLSVCAIVLR